MKVTHLNGNIMKKPIKPAFTVHCDCFDTESLRKELCFHKSILLDGLCMYKMIPHRLIIDRIFCYDQTELVRSLSKKSSIDHHNDVSWCYRMFDRFISMKLPLNPLSVTLIFLTQFFESKPMIEVIDKNRSLLFCRTSFRRERLFAVKTNITLYSRSSSILFYTVRFAMRTFFYNPSVKKSFLDPIIPCFA